MCLTISLAETAICARSKTSKRTTNVIIKKNGRTDRRKITEETPEAERPQSSGFLRHILEGERIQSPPLGLSLPLSLLPSPTHPLSLAVQRRKEGEQEPTPARAAANPCTAWAVITDCPPITFLFCDLESPIYPLYIYLLGSLWTLFSSRFPRPQDRPLHQSLPSSCWSCFLGFVVLRFWSF